MRWALRPYLLTVSRHGGNFTTVGHGVVVDFFASCFESTGFDSCPGYRNLDLGALVLFIPCS
jgi:hypothetical protein